MRSSLPDPAANDYVDCNFTALLTLASISTETDLPEEVIIVLPGFRNRTLCPEAALKDGDRIHGAFIAFDEAPIEAQRVQQSDQVEEIGLPVLLISEARTIIDWNDFPHRPRNSDRPIAEQAQPLPTRTPIQEQAIAAEIKRIEQLLADQGGDWDAWYQDLAPVREQVRAAAGPDLPFFHTRHSISSWHSLTNLFDPASADDANLVESLVEFENSVRRHGPDLILCPFPERDLIAIDAVFADQRPADGIWNPYRLRRNLALLKRGVEFFDATAAFRKPPADSSPLYYYESTDRHPSGGGADLLAALVHNRLEAYSWPAPHARSFTTTWQRNKAPAELLEGCPFQLDHRRPRVVDQLGVPVDGETSPVVLIGDSFLRNPTGGFWYLLCARQGYDCKTFVRTSGALQMPRHIARANPSLWQGRHVAVFVCDEGLLDLFPGQWVRTGSEWNERQRYQQLRATAELLFRFNDPADFALLPIREGYAGIEISPSRMLLPYAAVTYHIEAGHLDLTKHENEIGTVLVPESEATVLTIKIPKNGGNFFLRRLEVLAGKK